MSLFSHRKIRISKYKPQKEVRISRKAHDIDVRVTGYDNTVIVDSDSYRGQVCVYGVGNTVIIEPDVWVCHPCIITVGAINAPCFNSTVILRKGVYLAEVEILAADDNSRVEIGEGSMIGLGSKIWCTDGHAIMREDGSLNIGRHISIGKHVWMGIGCKVGKNTTVADGCMVGWGSVVNGRFEEPNCLIAGVPARVVRHGITWDPRRPLFVNGETLESQYPDWNAAARPAAALRWLLYLKLAWFRYQANHRSDEQKRIKYRVKAEETERRLKA